MKPGALLLTPGAGSDRNHPALEAVEAAVAPMPTSRIDFPYRKAGRRAPDRAPVLINCIREEAAAALATAQVRASGGSNEAKASEEPVDEGASEPGNSNSSEEDDAPAS